MSQASYLLGEVFRYNQSRSVVRAGVDSQVEYWQLDRTIRSLLNLTYIEGQLRRTAVCGQTSICYRYGSHLTSAPLLRLTRPGSALIALHDPQQSRTDPQHMQFTADLLKPVVDSMSWDSTVFLRGTMVSVGDASPLLLYWAYQAGTIYDRLLSLYGADSLQLLFQMRGKLLVMSRRWLAGGKLITSCLIQSS